MRTPVISRVVITLVLIAVVAQVISTPALSYTETGLWVGTIKHVSVAQHQIDVYSSEHRRSLYFVLPPGIPITSADGTQRYHESDLKVGTLVRVHVNMPWDWGYYAYGAVVGAMYVVRVDLLTGHAIHQSIQHSLRQTLPSPSPRPSQPPHSPVPIIFVSPSPK